MRFLAAPPIWAVEQSPRGCKSAMRLRKTKVVKKYWSHCREMMLLAIVHNITIILLIKKLFYGAGQIPLFHS